MRAVAVCGVAQVVLGARLLLVRGLLALLILGAGRVEVGFAVLPASADVRVLRTHDRGAARLHLAEGECRSLERLDTGRLDGDWRCGYSRERD